MDGTYAKFGEVSGFGTPAIDWPAHPLRYSVPEVASHYLRHRVSLGLRERGHTPVTLSEELGGEPVTWRSKLNGTRRFTLDDLVALSMLVPGLLHTYAPTSTDPIDDWLPISFRGLTHGGLDGSRVPSFVPPEVPWGAVARVMDGWWSALLLDGNAWAISLGVFVHEVLRVLDAHGLSRREVSAPARTGPDGLELAWLVQDVSLRVMWLDPLVATEKAGSITALSQIAEGLWFDEPAATAENILVIVASPAVVGGVRRVFAEAGKFEGAQPVLSLREAARLHGSSDLAQLRDVQVNELGSRQGPMIWLQTKRGSGVGHDGAR